MVGGYNGFEVEASLEEVPDILAGHSEEVEVDDSRVACDDGDDVNPMNARSCLRTILLLDLLVGCLPCSNESSSSHSLR